MPPVCYICCLGVCLASLRQCSENGVPSCAECEVKSAEFGTEVELLTKIFTLPGELSLCSSGVDSMYAGRLPKLLHLDYVQTTNIFTGKRHAARSKSGKALEIHMEDLQALEPGLSRSVTLYTLYSLYVVHAIATWSHHVFFVAFEPLHYLTD